MTEFTFNRFDDVEHMPLRTYNRTVFMNNIFADFGSTKLAEYVAMFTEIERKQMYIMQTFIQKFGLKKAQQEVTKGLELNDEVD